MFPLSMFKTLPTTMTWRCSDGIAIPVVIIFSLAGPSGVHVAAPGTKATRLVAKSGIQAMMTVADTSGIQAMTIADTSGIQAMTLAVVDGTTTDFAVFRHTGTGNSWHAVSPSFVGHAMFCPTASTCDSSNLGYAMFCHKTLILILIDCSSTFGHVMFCPATSTYNTSEFGVFRPADNAAIPMCEFGIEIAGNPDNSPVGDGWFATARILSVHPSLTSERCGGMGQGRKRWNEGR